MEEKMINRIKKIFPSAHYEIKFSKNIIIVIHNEHKYCNRVDKFFKMTAINDEDIDRIALHIIQEFCHSIMYNK